MEVIILAPVVFLGVLVLGGVTVAFLKSVMQGSERTNEGANKRITK